MEQEHQQTMQELNEKKKKMLQSVHSEIKSQTESIKLADSSSIELRLREMGIDLPAARL